MLADIQQPVDSPPPAADAASAGQRTHRALRSGLGVFLALMATTAIYGAIVVVPPLPRAWLHQGIAAPFADYTVPALALGLLCGGSALFALSFVLMRPRVGALASMIAGVCMIGFEGVEILVVGFTPVLMPGQPVAWLQVVYLVVGAAIVGLGAILWREETGSCRLRWLAALR